MLQPLKVSVAQVLTSQRLCDGRRWLASLRRRVTGRPAQLLYFHQVDDPYSHLLVQQLPRLLQGYEVDLKVYLVSAPPASAVPDRERLQRWSRRDAEQLAVEWGLQFEDTGQQPQEQALQLATSALAAVRHSADFLGLAEQLGRALWRNDYASLPAQASPADGQAALREGDQQLSRLGHYLGGMLYFESEWFWGVDRLHYLEQRLQAAGLGRMLPDSALPEAPRIEPDSDCAALASPRQLHFFCSLRSPYSYLAVQRVQRLAVELGAELVLRPVLPMVMRGLPVPLAKRLYIVRDCKREAVRLGLPFGRIADPLGMPTERGLAVLFHAITLGKGAAFLESFLRGVFAEGIDAGRPAGLHLLALRAGLTQPEVEEALNAQQWREQAEANRQELLAHDLWGVPAFRLGEGPMLWGQDRLYRLARPWPQPVCAS